MKSAAGKAPLVAIVGSGRSRSTLLEQMPGCAALGEVNRVYPSNGQKKEKAITRPLQAAYGFPERT